MDDVAIGEEVFATAFAFGGVEAGLVVVVQFGEWRRVVPDNKEAFIAHAEEERHGDGGVESRWDGCGPGIAAIVGEGFVVVVLGGADEHPESAVGQFDDGWFAAVVLPADTFVGPLDAVWVGGLERRTSRHVRPSSSERRTPGCVGAIDAALDGLDPAFSFAQGHRQASRESGVDAGEGVGERSLGAFG